MTTSHLSSAGTLTGASDLCFSPESFAAMLEDRPAGLPTDPVHVLVDLDHVSHLDAQSRIDDASLVALLDDVVGAVAPRGAVRFRAACSTETAFIHWQVLTLLPNNSWQCRKGIDGADQVIIEDLEHLARRPATRLVVLVGGDHAYADAVERLVTSGVQVWVLVRPGTLATRLADACTGWRGLPAPAPAVTAGRARVAATAVVPA